MALTNRSALDGVGFSKKHDAPPHIHKNAGPPRPVWVGFRRKRVFFIVLALVAVFFFVKNIPTDVVPVGQRVHPLYGSLAPGHVQAHAGQQKLHNANLNPPAESNYDGSVQIPNLAVSLRPHLSWAYNNNVLFVLPALSSTSNLVPIACQMAQNNRSTVHVAILGAQSVEVKDILSINGIKEDDCPVFWHDARPDRPFESSQERLHESIGVGFGFCCTSLRPQVALIDDITVQNMDISDVLRDVAWSTGVTLVDLPGDVSQSLPWIPSLDSSSLKKLKEIEIEIVIQAYAESAGPLLQLLRSIRNADYHGLSFPHLTIELPAQVDPFILNYLEGFRWPPWSSSSESRLTLRHRIFEKKQKAHQASMRTVESFFPRSVETSHVLLLSPDAELSPSYLHFLTLMLLEYKYGSLNKDQSQLLFGISLELPDKKLNGQRPFFDKSSHDTGPFVMLQAPSNNAALITGDRWVDLHKFLAQRLIRDPELALQTDAATLITQEHPQWLAEASNLMLAYNQYMLYPAFATSDDLKLMTLHRELHQSPEEYTQADNEEPKSKSFDVDHVMRNEVLTNNAKLPMRHDNSVSMASSLPLQKLLAFGGKDPVPNLPELLSIPLFTHMGKPTNIYSALKSSAEFSDNFSLQQGGCETLDDRDKTRLGSVNYLFCNVT